MTLPTALILSGLPRDQFPEDVQLVLQQGDALLKSPSESSNASAESPSQTSSAESGISSLSGDAGPAAPKSWPYYLDMLSALDKDIKEASSAEASADAIAVLPPRNPLQKSTKPPSNPPVKIMYRGRDILDLNENLRTKWPLRYREVKDELWISFTNKYYTADEAPVLPHAMIKCEEEDCDFYKPTFD